MAFVGEIKYNLLKSAHSPNRIVFGYTDVTALATAHLLILSNIYNSQRPTGI